MKKSFFGIRIHFKNGKNNRVTYFNTPEEAQSFFNAKKRELKAAIGENSIVADTLTYYEDEKVEISIEDAFFPA